MRKQAIARHPALSVFLLLTLIAAPAVAAIDSAGILDNVLARYSTAAATWGTIITTRATWLFWTLTLISMVWTFGMMAVRKADIGEFYAEFLRFTIFTGFFWWLLQNGPTFAASIMQSLRQVGAEATGLGNNLAPSGIVDIGFDIFYKVLDKSTVWSPIDTAIGMVMSGAILIVFALIGVNMLLLLISGWILAYAGVFFLGFGGSRWTSDMAVGYFKTVLNIAAQLFTMILLVGIGKSFVDQYYSSMSGGIVLKELAVMLVVAVVLMALVNKVPGLIGSLAGGHTGSLGAGFGAGAAVGAAMMGAAAVATAGAAIAAGATGLAGGAQALMAAYSKASAAEGAGGGAASALADAMGGGTSGDASGGDSSLAAAMGDSGASAGGGTSDSAILDESSDTMGATAAAGSQAMDETSGLESHGSGSDSSAGGSSADAGASSKAKRGGALAAAGAMAAKAGKIAAGTAVHLAQGSWDVAKAKVSDINNDAMDRIAETTGGKIAAAINAQFAAAGSSDATAPTFEDNSLAAGSDKVDADAEVAAFRDKSSDAS